MEKREEGEKLLSLAQHVTSSAQVVCVSLLSFQLPRGTQQLSELRLSYHVVIAVHVILAVLQPHAAPAVMVASACARLRGSPVL